MGNILVNSQNKPYVINGNVLEYEPMTLIRYWDGSDNLTNNNWYDRVGNQAWKLTSATHENGYYQFLNSTGSSANSYGALTGTLPDLGSHFKMEIIFELYDQPTFVGNNVVVDFGSICSTNDNSCACACYANSANRWALNAKLNGNSSGPTYNIEYITDNYIIPGTWVQRKATFGIRASDEIGKDECFMVINDIGTGTTTTKFTPVRMNRWNAVTSYIARSSVTPSTSYPYASNIRIYSIKIYVE